MGKYNDDMLKRCAEWVSVNGLYPQQCGAPIKQFCEAMGIGDDAYYEWMRTKPEFADAIKKAQAAFREDTTTQVVNALKRKALGYEYVAERKEAAPRKTVIYDPKTGKKAREEQGELTTVKAVRETVVIPPDTGAAIFLLTNLDPEHWKNRQTSDVRAAVDMQAEAAELSLSDIPEDVLFQLADAVQAAEYERAQRMKNGEAEQ